MSDDEIKKIPLDEIKTHPRCSPKLDDEFIRRYGLHVKSKLPAYKIIVPSAYVIPYDLNFYPVDWQPWAMFFESLKKEFKKKQYRYIWVYQSGRFFISSDSYPVYHAYLETDVPYMYCICLGKPDHPQAITLDGPLYPEDPNTGKE